MDTIDTTFATEAPALPGETVGCLSPGWCFHPECKARHESTRKANIAIARFVASHPAIASMTQALEFSVALYKSAAESYGDVAREAAALEADSDCCCDDEDGYICHACRAQDRVSDARSYLRLQAERVARVFEQARGAR